MSDGEGGGERRNRKPHDFEKLRSPTNAASDWRGAGSVDSLAFETSEAAFVGERSFSKSWDLRASGSFVPVPLPRHSCFFCSCPSFLDEPREETLATQARLALACAPRVSTQDIYYMVQPPV